MTTFGIVVARTTSSHGDANQNVGQARLDALSITGKAERVFLASPLEGILALVVMVNPVAAAVLAMAHEPSRVAQSQGDGNVPVNYKNAPDILNLPSRMDPLLEPFLLRCSVL